MYKINFITHIYIRSTKTGKTLQTDWLIAFSSIALELIFHKNMVLAESQR